MPASDAIEPLLSPDWYRVAGLRPRLRPDVGVSVQQVRGEVWVVLTDPASGRHHRFNRAAQALIGGCDGQRTIDQVWTAQVARAGDDAPSQGEAIRLLAQAFAANLLVGDIPPDAQALIRRLGQVHRRQRARHNPLGFRVPLCNPDAWLNRWLPWFDWLRAPATGWLIAALLGLGAVLLAAQADALASALHRQLGSGQVEGRLLLLMWLSYPLVKALHESAHALMVKLHGGPVNEVGVSLLFLQPVPYVDASASAAFAHKRQRIAVAAAGIVTEALLATLALLLWVLLEPGLARDAALAVVSVAGVSTLLVNGNPLLRFDGYHVLCDAAELPNLAARSNAWWQALAKRHLLRLDLAPVPLARGERPWLAAYAPLSWACRTALLLTLATALASWSVPLGLVVLALGLWTTLGKPLAGALQWLWTSPETQGRRGRTWAGAAGLCGLLAVLVFAVPLPDRTAAPGVVWLPDDAMVRPDTDGQLLAYARRDGDTVAAGDLIAQLANPELRLELQQAESRLAQQRVERSLQFERNAAALAVADDEILRLEAQVTRLRQRVTALTVRAGIGGRLVLNTAQLRPGQYLAQGELLAHVLPPGAPLVRALVRNEDVALVRRQAGTVEVQLAHDHGPARPAVLVAAVPSASLQLPSPALGEAAGGPLALDSLDPKGLTAREARFQFDLRLTDSAPAHVGARARVVFAHGQASLATLAWRQLRQAFLRHFVQ
jgi:putative peptide zinc metalloprotease protein